MEINREMVLLYALGRVKNPDHRALIEDRIANDAEVASWLEQLRQLGHAAPADEDGDGDELELDRQLREELEDFFPDQAPKFDGVPMAMQADAQERTEHSVQLPKPLSISRRYAVGASASSTANAVGSNKEAFCEFEKQKRLRICCPESQASFQHGVGLVRIYPTEKHAADNADPMATAVFAIEAVNGVYDSRIPFSRIQQGLVVDRKTYAQFWDDTETILAGCTLDDLRQLLARHDFGDEWREKVERLIELKQAGPVS